MEKVISLLGILVLVGICYALSMNRQKINWKLVGVGLGMQLVFALIILKTGVGRVIFQAVNSIFLTVLQYSEEGATFVFGSLGISPGNEGSLGFFFAFQVLSTIVFFASLMAILYHTGIMQRVVYYVAIVMEKAMGTSGAESLSAAANIFVGQTEAPLVVEPYVKEMTESELMAIMTGGLATVAGGVMAIYVGLLSAKFPDIAGHLMAASVMSAPASLVFAKIMVPETEKPVTSGEVPLSAEKVDQNVIDAAARGASEGMRLALNVGAMLIAFLALVAMFNGIWGWLCGSFGNLTGLDLTNFDTFQELMGYIFAPFAWIMGVPFDDLFVAGQLLGEKTILNELVAYTHFSDIMNGKPFAGQVVGELSQRTQVIMAYALCGFANFGSLGILLGGIGGIAPERRSDLAKYAIRALIAGTFASMVTGNIAGVLI